MVNHQMHSAEAGFRLSVVEEDALAEDAYPDLPVRLRVRGQFAEPVDGVEVADIHVLLDGATLADLIAQGRALQLTLGQRARRAALRAEATRVAHSAGPVAADPRERLELLVSVRRGLEAYDTDGPRADNSSTGWGGP
jgi:hypothetical protein